jgi:hypothetical protein
MERIFSTGNNAYGILSNVSITDGDPDEVYIYTVKALIADTVDFEASELAGNREIALDYYYGLRPALLAEEDEPVLGDENEDDNQSRSTVVSTDVRDTVLAIMPSLMRIFAGTEHALEFVPNTPEQEKMAEQATDYVRYKFWHSNEGFRVLYEAIWDACVLRAGIITWGTDTEPKRSRKRYELLTQEQLAGLLNEEELNPQLISYGAPRDLPGTGPVIDNVTIEFTKSVPQTWVNSIAPESFRISRNAKTVDTADICGYEEILRVSDLVEKGFEYEEIAQYAGVVDDFSIDRQIRQPGSVTGYPLNDQVLYGCFWVRVDKDGDGINELRCIHTIGENYDIIADEEVDATPIALILADITPHTAIGQSIADLVMDIQRIKTNLMRGGLDSLAQSIFPRTVFNPLMTETEDVMSDDIGAAIRTRGDPSTAVNSFVTPYVGKDTLDVANYLDQQKASRTGISEASKGLDPKALQSTALSGIDLIATGAQERIELIARIIAETGLKRMYAGLLKEVTDNPNRGEMAKLRGVWVQVDPSLYDPDMLVNVNPSLGKGSDLTRLQALQGIAAAQQSIVTNYGFGNGVVGPQEMRNTQVDILALVNIKNATRYFREITPDQATAIENAPKQPDANTLLAQSQMEGVKAKTAIAVNKSKQDATKAAADQTNKDKELDFKYKQLHTDSFVQLVGFLKDGLLAQQQEDEVLSLSPEK